MCVDLDLCQPQQQGNWVQYGNNYVFILALYEKLPVFCYKCGRVRHGEASCSFTSSRQRIFVQSMPPVPVAQELMQTGKKM